MERMVVVIGSLLLLLHLHGAQGRWLDAAAPKGVNHVVGGEVGWHVAQVYRNPTFYQDWVNHDGPFLVNDTVEFKYTATETIAVVDALGFTTCNGSKSGNSFSSGHSVVTLDRAGPMYFIAVDPAQCFAGMRMKIGVIAKFD